MARERQNEHPRPPRVPTELWQIVARYATSLGDLRSLSATCLSLQSIGSMLLESWLCAKGPAVHTEDVMPRELGFLSTKIDSETPSA